jgi:hypothetical protein
MESIVADGNGGGGNTLLAVIVGGLLVVGVAFFAFGGFPGQHAAPSGPSITVKAPSGQ